jgi:hypothetical protein
LFQSFSWQARSLHVLPMRPALSKVPISSSSFNRVKLPEIKGEARVWIPLAKTDAFQDVTEDKLNIPVKWEKVQDRDYGNDICVLHLNPLTVARRSSSDTGSCAGKKPPILQAVQNLRVTCARKNSCR